MNYDRSFPIIALLLLLGASGVRGQVATTDADEPVGFIRNPARARYDVIALRVEFQPDSSRFSTGDGTFGGDLFPGLEARIDPLPHDAGYFEAHLAFLETYVDHVSRGATEVRTHLVPEVVRVSGTMSDYSPVGPDAESREERAKLATLVKEAWTMADLNTALQLPPDLDPQATGFILFHAGTGRDIELTGTTLDRTPEDIPSLFFDERTLTDLVGSAIQFAGIPVTSTAVVPETESKRGVDPISENPFLLELSINGLIAASFFNYLGVPDLFDTATGGSAIGPYGLMDPLGIFAYGGLLPPEPSGWTKYYLGWVFPQTLDPGQDAPSQASLRAGIDVAIAPASSSEYFLAETRHRDTGADGLNLLVYRDGQLVEQRFEHDSDDFTSFDQSGFEGVLVSADDYDWALPGGFDSSGELRLGGILLWHVDDNRIAAGLETNTVNADPEKRGLDVEEADSAPDLGYPSNNPFAPEFDRGTPFDFYFDGNPVLALTESGEVRLYQNRFASDTWPSSNTNAGGPSFVVLEDFSEVGTTMSLTFRRENASTTKPIPSWSRLRVDGPVRQDGSVSLVTLDRGPAAVPALFVQNGAQEMAWLVVPDFGVVNKLEGVVGKPAVTATPGASKITAYLQRDDTGEIYFTLIPPGQGPPQVRYPLPADVRRATPSTPLIALTGSGEPEYYVGYDLGSSGTVIRINSSGESELIGTDRPVRSIAGIDQTRIAVVEDDKTVILAEGDVVEEWTYAPVQDEIGQAAFGVDATGGTVGVLPLVNSKRFIMLTADGQATELTTWSTGMSHTPTMADIDGDGRLDVVYATGFTLEALSQSGAVLAGFPIDLPSSTASQVLVAKWEDERLPSLFISLRDGYLHAYSLDEGRPRDGFPLPVGGSGAVTPIVSDSLIFGVSADGAVSAWTVDGLDDIIWGELYAGSDNTSFAITQGSGGQGAEGTLLDEDETYNWPNPVTDGVTRIRVKTRERCEIRMTVVDMSGALMFKDLLGESLAGVPTEFVWRPDVASGVFFAKIEAVATGSGDTATKLIRIAVVR